MSAASVTHWEPRWEPPTISARCPSCGTVAERGASAWALRSPDVRATMVCDCGRVWEVTAPEPESVTFPTDAEVEAATHALADSWNGMHTNEALGYQRMLAGRSLVALAPLIRAREAAAWDEGQQAEAEAQFRDGGYGNVQHPLNPYRQEADDDRD